jgi:histidinol dehydrogenase
MFVHKHPSRHTWPELLARPSKSAETLDKPVRKVLERVQKRGDAAVKAFTKQFDGVSLRKLAVTPKEVKAAKSALPESLKAAIQLAAANIERFHQAQVQEVQVVETMPGVRCWRKSLPIERVGLYIPGGTAPLFSTILMLGIPARIAGCKEVILCSPPDKEGNLHPAILYAADLVGITNIYKAGGAHAIAAMAYGTNTIPKVDKIFGPGNQYVTHAKQLVQLQGVAIDMPAGPSEVCVVADDTSRAAYVAADLLSHAEHGVDSQVLLVADSERMINMVLEEVDKQLSLLARRDIAGAALEHSRAILVKDKTEAMAIVNAYAPEHLILSCAQAEELAEQVVNAGSVFIGDHTPESAGDYASGTNHTLPTHGFARAYSGVSVDSFVKKVTFQQISRAGLEGIGPAIVAMAEAEGLQAHAEAVRVRLA